MPEHAVILEDVSKHFQVDHHDDVVAVDRLSLEIRRGEIFSLVGPDGAGKTTTIRMMCGVLTPSLGSISILGMNVLTSRHDIKSRIGYLSQRFSLYGDLTIDENLDFFAEIHRIKDYRSRKDELLEFTRLRPFRNRLADRLSGGMKQKLALACTLIHTPDVIFLDEPTTGVDPVSRRDFWKILSSLLKSGITIIVSTPYLDEAERSTRVALLHQGKLLVCETPEAVKAGFEYDVLEVLTDDVRRTATLVNEAQQGLSAQLFGDRLHVIVPRGGSGTETLKQLLRGAGISIDSTRPIAPSLEDVFITKTMS